MTPDLGQPKTDKLEKAVSIFGEYPEDRAHQLFRQGLSMEWWWDPNEIDISQDVEDFEQLGEQAQMEFTGVLSGFYDGEMAVTETLGPYQMAVQALDDDAVSFHPPTAEMFLTQQAFEEGRHTDFFARYYEEVIGDHDISLFRQGVEGWGLEDIYHVGDDLARVSLDGDQNEILRHLGEAVMLYMGVLEGIGARGLYMATDQVIEQIGEELGRDQAMPGLKEVLGGIRDDEGRHIGHGQWLCGKIAETDPSVIEDIYIPMMDSYLDTNVLGPGMGENMTHFNVDKEPIRESQIAYVQENIDVIGREKFPEEFQNAEEIVNRKQEAQAADD